MDSVKLASGDNKISLTPRQGNETKLDEGKEGKQSPRYENQEKEENDRFSQNEVTAQMIDDNETKMKERIAQCKNIIESLKIELNEEKAKLEKQNKATFERSSDCASKCTTSFQCVSTSNLLDTDVPYTSNMYSDCVDCKLSCDENLIEYEKQLQKYQNTLNLAQIEKKNAIRKQMLAKAYRLKLLEVENQCNIELLRVKQSLQCLEPLKMIASKWKNTNDEIYDVNNFELIPRYPELNATNSSSDITTYELDVKGATERIEGTIKDESMFLE